MRFLILLADLDITAPGTVRLVVTGGRIVREP